MADDDGPRNRKERRAAAKQSGKAVEPPSSTPKIKMAQPDRSGPKSKTFMDLYEEKKDLLDQGQPFASKYEDGRVRDEGGNILEAGLGDDEEIGPVGMAVFWALTLGMVHFTLDVLVYSQYRQEIEWWEIVKRTAFMMPILFLMILTMKSAMASRFRVARQIFFLGVAIAAGCYTIHAANAKGYYAVMKRCPPLGTLWVWSVIEMDLPYASVSVMVDIWYLWWKGYSAFLTQWTTT
ncbi:uncharacterized protein LTR77_007354 [Saxophila tyrrhenica]|uniref:DUF7719 domain-containing protein n=1 Tax=Saxophila tyrrhenica TaxID=1690608 RepID=A0AAV9P571_9PEZI|nr:hypothetical protein LTR77_007354 [Saxophila tyrrhenica]